MTGGRGEQMAHARNVTGDVTSEDILAHELEVTQQQERQHATQSKTAAKPRRTASGPATPAGSPADLGSQMEHARWVEGDVTNEDILAKELECYQNPESCEPPESRH